MAGSQQFRRAAMAATAACCVAACSAHSPVRTASTQPAAAAHGASSTSAAASAPSLARAVELTCDDSAAAQAPSRRSPDGLTLESQGQAHVAAASPADSGFELPAAAPRYFLKDPVYLTAGTTPITVRVATPGSALMWVPGALWTGGPPAGGQPAPLDVRPYVATTVTLDGCPDRDTAYLGGFLVPGQHVCLTVIVTRAGTSAPPSRQHLGPPGC